MFRNWLQFVSLCGFLTVAICHPTKNHWNLRERRQLGQNQLADDYWNSPVNFGFFVNEKNGETGDQETEKQADEKTVRDKIERTEVEGSGEIKRDEIQTKPAEPVIENASKKSNEEVSTEESGKLHAKLETSEEVVKSDAEDRSKISDPEDKSRARTTVTCQGQKEWLQCDGPYELIKIKSAFWGRDNDHTCTKSGVTHGLKTDKTCAQDEANTLNKVKEACDNENVCEVVASGVYFDKADCTDVYKFLRMEWACAPSESRIKEPVS